MDDELLPSSEEARTRRRDRRTREIEHALMKPGAAKVFKQILDRQVEVGQEARAEREARADRGTASTRRHAGRHGDPATRSEDADAGT